MTATQNANHLAMRFAIVQERRGLSRKTISGRGRVVRRFLQSLGERTVGEVTAEDVEVWLDSRRLNSRSRYTYLSSLCAFYDVLKTDKVVDSKPVAGIRRPKYRAGLPRPIAEDDFLYAFSQSEPLMRAWLALAAYQGLWCHEIAGLYVEDVLMERKPPLLIVRHGKGDKERILPLNPHAAEALRHYGIAGRGALFRMSDGSPYKAGTVSVYISRHLRGMGIMSSAHRLRHLFGTKLYEMTKDIRVTQAMLGHADPKTTSIYVAFSTSDATEAMQALTFEATTSRYG